MAMSQAARNAKITKHPDGSTTAQINIKVSPRGRIYINGQVRHRAVTAVQDMVDVLDWTDWIHSQRRGQAAA